jgi:hypothetical protein
MHSAGDGKMISMPQHSCILEARWLTQDRWRKQGRLGCHGTAELRAPCLGCGEGRLGPLADAASFTLWCY